MSFSETGTVLPQRRRVHPCETGQALHAIDWEAKLISDRTWSDRLSEACDKRHLARNTHQNRHVVPYRTFFDPAPEIASLKREARMKRSIGEVLISYR